jgi:hypothetical protein
MTTVSEEQEKTLEEQEDLIEPLLPEETMTVADMPPDLGNPAVADFPDPAWDDTTDETGETPDLEEPEDSGEDEPEEGVVEDDDEDDEDEPVVPPGIVEDQIEQALEPDEPDDYDPEE